MYLTKVWLFVLSFALAGALALALLVPRPAVRELEREESLRLGHVQHAAQLLLKVDARAKMDYASHLAADAFLAGALEETARGASDRALHQTALERLRVFNERLKLAFLVVLDTHGRVLARVTESGEGDAHAYGDSMAGFPVVADALRGYRGEDAFAIGSKLYRVAASPVVSRARDRYVGALVIGMEAGGELAKRMHESLDADVAFFLRGRLIAASASTPALSALPDLLARHAEEAQKNGRTGALALESGHQRFWAMATPIAGEAAQQDAYYVLLLPRTEGTGLGGFLSATTGEDLKSAFPWALVAVVAILALVSAMVLLWYESEGPLGRLRDETARLAAGEMSRIDDRLLRGRFAALARSINAALDRWGRAASGPIAVGEPAPTRAAQTPARERGERSERIERIERGERAERGERIDRPDREPSRPRVQAETPIPAGFDLPMAAGEAAPLAAPRGAAASSRRATPAGGLPQFRLDGGPDPDLDKTDINPPSRDRRPAALAELPSTLPQLDAIPLEPPMALPLPPPRRDREQRPAVGPGTPPLGLPELPPVPGRGLAPPPPAAAGGAPPPLPEGRPESRSAPRQPTALGLGVADFLGAQPLQPSAAAPGSGVSPAGLGGGARELDLAATTLPSTTRPEDFADKTLVQPPSNDLVSQTVREGGGSARELESYYRKIYQDFVDLKRKCGEPTENVTYEKFVAKLKDNREQLIRKFGCKSVRFQVYVKDGRAALKATPVRE
ncbi:MAG TPA: MXAN_5187 C-terminal domain-containing protein [Polyangia bacterium]|nr:MXAN_5187 C-terminal domain-containing protein [Polyangia bacterium]